MLYTPNEIEMLVNLINFSLYPDKQFKFYAYKLLHRMIERHGMRWEFFV